MGNLRPLQRLAIKKGPLENSGNFGQLSEVPGGKEESQVGLLGPVPG